MPQRIYTVVLIVRADKFNEGVFELIGETNNKDGRDQIKKFLGQIK
jgi:hypothetical protein